jgi:hypothetical protein
MLLWSELVVNERPPSLPIKLHFGLVVCVIWRVGAPDHLLLRPAVVARGKEAMVL